MIARELKTAIRAILVLTLALGVVYPLAITAVGQLAMPGRANGSVVEHAGEPVGSKLIGQDFAGGAQYFQSRPSVSGYSPSVTYFPNLGPNSADLRDQLAGYLREYLKREGPYNPDLEASDVPADAVTDSASGVDPAISPANARIQAARVADQRGLPLARVNALIKDNTDGALPLVFGEDAVNVFQLNNALDALEQQ